MRTESDYRNLKTKQTTKTDQKKTPQKTRKGHKPGLRSWSYQSVIYVWIECAWSDEVKENLDDTTASSGNVLSC